MLQFAALPAFLRVPLMRLGERLLPASKNRARQAARDADQAQQALERLASRKAEMAERLDRVAKWHRSARTILPLARKILGGG